jgi:hypothetical protein
MDATFRVETSPFSQLDQRFLLILFASIATHVLIATWVAHQPAPPLDVELEQPLDRFAPLHPIPKFAPQPPPAHVARVKPAPVPAAPAPRPAAPGPTGPAKPPGLLGLVAGGFGDLSNGDAQSALEGAHRGPVDTTVTAVRRDGAQHVETVAPIVTDGTKQIGYGEPLPPRGTPFVRGHIDEPIPVDPPPGLPDPDQLQRFIRAHQKALLYCYEGVLKRQTTLRGKVVVRLTVSTLGRAAEVSVSDVSLNSAEVASCVRGNVERWVFPFKPEDDLHVEFPVLFSPAQ